jgi:drug/metabolite transporter (DMT)-like permease
MLALAMIMLGSSFVAAKAMIEEVPKFLALAFRLGLATLIMLPIVVVRERSLPRMDKEGWFSLLVLGGVGVVLFNWLMFSSYERTTACSAGIIFGMLPIAIAGLSWLMLRERPTSAALFAVLLAALGTAQLNLDGGLNLMVEPVVLIGNLMVVAAVLCEGLFSVLGKRLTARLSPLGLAALLSFICFLMVLPLGVREALAFDFAAMAASDLIGLVWWAFASGIGYFFLWLAGLARVDASKAAVFTVFLPVSTVGLAALILGEAILMRHILGMVAALAAILLVAFQSSFRRFRPRALSKTFSASVPSR